MNVLSALHTEIVCHMKLVKPGFAGSDQTNPQSAHVIPMGSASKATLDPPC